MENKRRENNFFAQLVLALKLRIEKWWLFFFSEFYDFIKYFQTYYLPILQLLRKKRLFHESFIFKFLLKVWYVNFLNTILGIKSHFKLSNNKFLLIFCQDLFQWL